MKETGHTPSWTLDTLSELSLHGRIVHLNSMLVGLQIAAYQEDKEFIPYTYEGEKNEDEDSEDFSSLWNRIENITPDCQQTTLERVHSWQQDETNNKSNLQKASVTTFFTTGNSFSWERNPELFERLKKTVQHIGDAHAVLERKFPS